MYLTIGGKNSLLIGHCAVHLREAMSRVCGTDSRRHECNRDETRRGGIREEGCISIGKKLKEDLCWVKVLRVGTPMEKCTIEMFL